MCVCVLVKINLAHASSFSSPPPSLGRPTRARARFAYIKHYRFYNDMCYDDDDFK